MEIVKSIDKLYDQIDELLESDEADLASDLIKVLGKLEKGISYLRKKNFIKFLKGLSVDSVTEVELKRLSKYIDNKVTSEYLLQYIIDLLSSKSNMACLLSGIYVARLMKEDRAVDFEAMNILGFLTVATDYDILNLKYISNYLVENNMIGEKFYHSLSKKDTNINEFESLFDKCSQFSILGVEYISDDIIEVENYRPNHPLETGYRSNNQIELQESYYKKPLFSLMVELIEVGNINS